MTMKTPEELAEEYADSKCMTMLLASSITAQSLVRRVFLAGYKAAKEQLETEYSALVSKGKVAMQTLNDQLADVSKVIIPQENCEAALNAMQLAQDLSEQAIRWMKTLPSASERCNQCAREGYRAGYQAAAPQWISVKDRLPEIPENDYSNRVLLLRTDGFIVIARIEKCVRFVRPLQQALIVETDNGDPIEEFSHWMPLPKPPEEK